MSGEERWQGRVEVRPSSIQGLGLFAARDFAAGEVILDRDESRTVDDEHPLAPGELRIHCDDLWVGRVILLPYPERHLNHSCAHNAWIQWDLDARGHIAALRQIAAGEEITNFYPLNADGDGEWQCRCGASSCLGNVPVSYFALDSDRQWELLPLLSEWFVLEHQEQIQTILGGNEAG